MKKSNLENRLYNIRFKILFLMLVAMMFNAASLAEEPDILFSSFLVQALFGQAFFSYLSGWRISIGIGVLGETSFEYGRDLMGGFVLLGFVLSFFFRGY